MADPAPSRPDLPEAPQKSQRRTGFRRFLKIFFLAALAFVILAAAGTWFSRDWIAAKIDGILKDELDKRGLYVDYTVDRWRPGRGLVLRVFTVYRDADRTSRLFFASNASARFHWLSGLPGARIATNDSRIVAYTGKNDFTITGLDTLATIDADEIVIGSLKGEFQGILFSASGRIDRKQGDEKTRTASADGEQPSGAKIDLTTIDLSVLDKIADFARFERRGEKPTFDLEFSLSEGGAVSAHGTLDARAVTWRKLAIDQLHAPFDLERNPASDGKQALRLEGLALTYGGQPITASLSLDLAANTLSIASLDSRADLLAFQHDLTGKPVGKVTLKLPPRVQASGTVPLADPAKANLDVTLSGVNAIAVDVPDENASVSFEQLAGQLRIAEGVVSSDDFSLSYLGQAIAAGFSLDPGTNTLQLKRFDSRADLLALTGELTGKPITTVAFDPPPRIQASGTVPLADPGKSTIDVILSEENSVTVNAGNLEAPVRFDQLKGTFGFDGGALTSKNLDLTYRGKPIAARFRYDLPAHSVIIESFDSRADLITLAGELTGKPIAGVAFDPPPHVQASGTVPLGDIKKAVIKASLSEENTLTVAAGPEGSLRFENITGDFHLAEGALSSDNLEARFLDGALSSKTSVAVFADPLRLGETTVRLRDASAARTLVLLHPAKPAETTGSGGDANPTNPAGPSRNEGKLNLSFTGAGEPSLAGIDGNGHLEITDTELFRIPIYGKLITLFSKLIPKFGRETPAALSTDFALRQGTLSSENLVLNTTGAIVNAAGDVNFVDESVQSTASVSLGGQGVAGIPGALLGQALEIEASGHFGAVEWQFKNIPGLKKFGELGNLGGDAVVKLLSGKPGQAVKKTGGAILNMGGGGTADAAKDLIGGLKKLPGLGILRKKDEPATTPTPTPALPPPAPEGAPPPAAPRQP